MTKIFDDTVTPLNEANLNKMLAADGNVEYACWGLKIQYTGSWIATASTGATDQIANVVLTWDAGNDWLEIDTSACDNPFSGALPVPVATPDLGLTTFWVKAHQNTTNETRIQFYNRDSTQTLVTTESADMDFTIIWFGAI